ncbi:hypothetical protein BJX99DRAFT_272649 [Aspergillus californicus]
MPASLKSLPVEILYIVTDILASDHQPSLHAFSLTNKFYCAIATSNRFRNIHFNFLSSNVLIDIQRWDRVLGSSDAFSFVQRLSINVAINSSNHKKPREHDLSPKRSHETFQVEDAWTDISRRYSSQDNPPPKIVRKKTLNAWNPISDFVKKLSGLRDLFWVSPGQFPPCLLDALHRDLPKCRLHLRCATLRDLYGEADQPNAYNALIRSPSLASIAFETSDTAATLYTERAVAQMAAGLAPNLSQIHMTYHTEPLVVNTTEQLFLPPKSPSRLHSLSLHDPAPGTLELWNQRVSFSDLRSFHLCLNQNDSTLAKAAGFQFCSLDSLTLRLLAMVTIGSNPIASRMDSDASLFLSGLLPLRRLLITGLRAPKATKAALKHHGSTLHSLGLLFYQRNRTSRVTLRLVNSIRVYCSKLRGLTIVVPRTQGDAWEVSIYRALGGLASLNRLTLELQCTVAADNRAALINIAVDEKLVRSIFTIIAGQATLLETLKVEVILSSVSYNYNNTWLPLPTRVIDTTSTYEERIFPVVTGVWELFRAPDGHVSVCDGQDMQNKARDMKSYICQWLWIGVAGPEVLSLWPEGTEWHSFPLQE